MAETALFPPSATVGGLATTQACCTSLVSCLPALESVSLHLPRPLALGDLGCLLEALAWCPRLTVLDLDRWSPERTKKDQAVQPTPTVPAFAKLRSLTELLLSEFEPLTLVDVVDALVSLTGLAELKFPRVKLLSCPPLWGSLGGCGHCSFAG